MDNFDFLDRNFQLVEANSGGKFDLDDWLIDRDPHLECTTDRLSYLGLGTFNVVSFQFKFPLPPVNAPVPAGFTWRDCARAMNLFPDPTKIEDSVVYGYFSQALDWDTEDEDEFMERWVHWKANPVQDPVELTSDSSDDDFDDGGIPDCAIPANLFGESPESNTTEDTTVDGDGEEDIDIRSPPVKRQCIERTRSLSY